MHYVQAYISNISFPTSLDEVYSYAHLFNMEMILGCDFYNLLNDENYMDFGNVEKYESRKTEWTAPKWCKDGDIVLFMHSKTANARISAMKTQLLSNRSRYSPDFATCPYKNHLKKFSKSPLNRRFSIDKLL
ncbi:MAG: hypothetical protein IJ595_00135 [Oscillospiraceae bacterium]|nr:hypothetical protein [Oscillospiraceae bacterium]